jgi:hypothetical protein
MIGKGRSISHLKVSINYALNHEKSKVLAKNIASESPGDVEREFGIFQSFNDRCERNSLAFVLSPTIEDGKHLSDEALAEINKSFLEKMNLENHQYIAFVHDDKAHKHIHLYVNRIDSDGRAYDDTYMSNRSSQTAEEIARERNLSLAKDMIRSRNHDKDINRSQKTEIKGLAKEVLSDRSVNSVERFVEVFNEKGLNQGLSCDAYHNKQGDFQGLRFYEGEEKFKASEIHKSLSKQNLEGYFNQDRGLVMDRDVCKEKATIGRSMNKHGYDLEDALDLISSLSDQDDCGSMGVGEDDDDEDPKRRRGRGMRISR